MKLSIEHWKKHPRKKKKKSRQEGMNEDRTRGTDAYFFSCTRDQRTCVGSRLDGQGHVDCLSPRAHQKSLILPVFRGTLHESQFSSAQFGLIVLLCTTCTDITAAHGNEYEPPASLREEVSSLADWPSRALTQVVSPIPSSKSAMSTRRSVSLRERTASTQTSTISRPRWLHLKSLIR